MSSLFLRVGKDCLFSGGRRSMSEWAAEAGSRMGEKPPSRAKDNWRKGKVAQTACMSACKHLSTSLMQLLLEVEVRQLSLGALRQFNLDVEECEGSQWPTTKGKLSIPLRGWFELFA
ncbi:UNVERIFIED_CONTAM: hypothetical protein K2H54_003678 [Gekko kuhli]